MYQNYIMARHTVTRFPNMFSIMSYLILSIAWKKCRLFQIFFINPGLQRLTNGQNDVYIRFAVDNTVKVMHQ